MKKPRQLSEVAKEIRASWQKVNYAAEPYLAAMERMGTVDEYYGCDEGRGVVLYFLSNAGTWRGDVARRVKAELQEMALRVPVE